MKTRTVTTDLHRAVAGLQGGKSFRFARVPDGFDAFVAADLVRGLADKAEGRAVALLVVSRDGQRSRAFQDALAFAAPEIEVLDFPAWDCQPYDRISPNAAVSARRMTALARLAASSSSREKPRVLCTTVNALVQRVPPRDDDRGRTRSPPRPATASTPKISCAGSRPTASLRASTVRDTGDYAVRGGIVDLFPPGLPSPIRLDFFGDTLESIRAFDPETQRSTATLRSLDLVPMSEVQLTTQSMKRFRQAYVAGIRRADVRRSAVRGGQRGPAPSRHGTLAAAVPRRTWVRCSTIAGDAPIFLDNLAEDAAGERLAQVKDYYDARKEQFDHDKGGASLQAAAARCALSRADRIPRNARCVRARQRITPFDVPENPRETIIDCGGAAGAQFRARAQRRERQCFRGGGRPYRGAARGGHDGHRRRLVGRVARSSRRRARRTRTEEDRAGVVARAGARRQRRAARGHRRRAGLRRRPDRGHRRTGHSRRPPRARRQAPQDAPRTCCATCRRWPPAISSSMPITASAASSRLRRSRRSACRTTASNCIMRAATSCSCRSRISNFCRAMARNPRATRCSTSSAAPAGRTARRGCASASARSRRASSDSRRSARLKPRRNSSRRMAPIEEFCVALSL